MKIRNCFIGFVCLLFCRISISEAGQFINLGFDDANYSGNQNDMQSAGLVSDLLPGWRLFYGTTEQPWVGFNSAPPTGAPAGGHFSSIYNFHFTSSVEGQYLFGASNPLGGPRWVLEQQGDVPANAQLLSYRGSVWYAPWTVEVNGIEIPRIPPPLSAFTTNVFFYNIAAFAGKSVTLDFLSPDIQSPGGFIDSITFSVPEPNVCQAGPFINLGFDDANYSGDQSDMQSGGPLSDLLPGWRLFYGTNEQFGIGFNLVVDSGSEATLFNRFLVPTVEGQYLFQVGNSLGGPSWVLEQQGDVPQGTRMLSYTGTLLWTVEVNGAVVVPATISPISPGIGQVFYDFSQFAGKPVKLDFVSAIQNQDPFGQEASGELDSITFIIPEPPFGENDFDSDGASDVVFEHQDGFVGVWFMNKGPDLISASFFNPKAVDLRWHVVGTGNFVEFNTNKTDLLFQHEDGSLAVWAIHEGTNLFYHVLLNPSQPGDGWKVVGTGDMNHDGKKDILFQHTDGTLGVWFMDGINLVQSALLNPNQPGDSGWRVVGTAALSSVGNTDLIFQHTDGTLAAWYMDGTNLVRGVLLNPATPGEAGWRVATTLDLNGDGKTDLLFQHEDGRMAVWLMDGINLISGEFLNPENPGAGWRIAGPR